MTLHAAQDYARRGWKVLPLRGREKTPLTVHGLLEASGAVDVIADWWGRWPDANVGIATGAVSGLVVLDVDPAHGGAESMLELEQRVTIPPTPEVITGGGGRHLYFSHPGIAIRNAAGLLGLPGLDLRGDGGYVVAPPSLHPNGRRYEWDILTEELPLAAFPAGIAAPEVRRAERMPDRIPHGQRETVLTSLAGSMRRRGATARSIEAALLVENLRCDPPLSGSAVRRIAYSVAQYAAPTRTAMGGLP